MRAEYASRRFSTSATTFCLASGGKILLHVQLARHLAQPTVECGDSAFPALALLRLAVQNVAVEVKTLRVECGRQHICIGCQILIFEIGVPALDRNLLEQCTQCLNRIELAHHKLGLIVETLCGQQRLPGEAGTELIQLRACPQVVGQIALAPFGCRPMYLGDLGLDVEYGGCLRRRLLFAGKRQHPLDVRLVLRSQVGEYRIVLQVVVPIGQAEPALQDDHNVAIGIFLIGGDSHAQRRFEIQVRSTHEVSELLMCTRSGNCLESRQRGRQALLLDGSRVEVGAVKVAGLLLGAALRRIRR